MFEETNVKKGKEPESQKLKIYEKGIKSPNGKAVKSQTAHFISEEFANRRFLFGLIEALLVWSLNKCRLSSTL